jgi:hypothetical protein
MMPAKEQPVVVFREQLAHQRDHHDGRGQIVEDRTQEEGDKADQPHQRRKLCGTNALGDDIEAVVRIDHLDDGHGAHEEEHDLGGGHHGLAKFLADLVRVAAEQGVNRPQQARADERRRGLVDLDRVFQRDRGIRDDEDEDERSQHVSDLCLDFSVRDWVGLRGSPPAAPCPRQGDNGTRRNGKRACGTRGGRAPAVLVAWVCGKCSRCRCRALVMTMGEVRPVWRPDLHETCLHNQPR